MTQRLESPVDEGDHVRDGGEGAVEVVVYGDYECPFTRQTDLALRALRHERPDLATYVYRHFPLEHEHPHARGAAEAAEAAAEQGRFWEFHDQLIDHPEQLDAAGLKTLADATGLDASQLSRERDSGIHSGRVDRDVLSGKGAGVEGTPTSFVDGERQAFPLPPEALVDAIRAARDRRSG